MKQMFAVEIEQLQNELFECRIAPAGVDPSEAWGASGEGRTMSEAFTKVAWAFERLEEANPSLLHKDYPALLLDIQYASDFVPWHPPR